MMKTAAVIGGGPAGLMAAEMLSLGGVKVHVYDAMPSMGRKFLLAGVGGMNLTHSEPTQRFITRYAERCNEVSNLLADFGADELRAWSRSLGIETFVGSSGRVFPVDMKAAPLLRAWLQRLRKSGVEFHVRHRWLGWDIEENLVFDTPGGQKTAKTDVLVLALGGGSWSRLGSDGAWVKLLVDKGVRVQPLKPANCGFNVAWSAHFRDRFAGHAVKSVVASITDLNGVTIEQKGEFVVTNDGVEGSLIYALSSVLRENIISTGSAALMIDLLPDKSSAHVEAALALHRGKKSLSSHLRSRLGLEGVKAGLLREDHSPEDFVDMSRLAARIKRLPIVLHSTRPLDEAISSAGGVAFEALDATLMLQHMPGIFCAGEMLDWEAPTGGYLLTACFASGRAAGLGALTWLGRSSDA